MEWVHFRVGCEIKKERDYLSIVTAYSWATWWEVPLLFPTWAWQPRPTRVRQFSGECLMLAVFMHNSQSRFNSTQQRKHFSLLQSQNVSFRSMQMYLQNNKMVQPSPSWCLSTIIILLLLNLRLIFSKLTELVF